MQLDKYRGQRKHAWVLVKKGKRNVKEDFFIEPSTGRQCALKESEYISVDSVFNHKNYWVNMN